MSLLDVLASACISHSEASRTRKRAGSEQLEQSALRARRDEQGAYTSNPESSTPQSPKSLATWEQPTWDASHEASFRSGDVGQHAAQPFHHPLYMMVQMPQCLPYGGAQRLGVDPRAAFAYRPQGVVGTTAPFQQFPAPQMQWYGPPAVHSFSGSTAYVQQQQQQPQPKEHLEQQQHHRPSQQCLPLSSSPPQRISCAAHDSKPNDLDKKVNASAISARKIQTPNKPKSKYVGVSSRQDGKFKAVVVFQGQSMFIGAFSLEDDAALHYDVVAAPLGKRVNNQLRAKVLCKKYARETSWIAKSVLATDHSTVRQLAKQVASIFMSSHDVQQPGTTIEAVALA